MIKFSTELSGKIRAGLALAVTAIVLAGVGSAHAADGKSGVLFLNFGKAEIITLDGDVADIMIANPSVIEATAVQSNRLYIAGATVGDTNVIVLDAQGNILKKLDVHVRYDVKAIQELVDHLFPKEHVKITSIHDQIILGGRVSSPAVASKVTQTVGHYVSDLQDSSDPVDQQINNMLEVAGEQQVMLRVKIIEASRSVLKELGIESSMNDPNELATTTLFGRTPFSAMGGRNTGGIETNTTGLTQDPFSVGRFLHDTGIPNIGMLEFVINALETENLVNVLAEPNLTAISGEQAGFLAGGEFPVPVGRDQVGNIVIEFRQFGVSLNFRPTVLSSDRVSLQLNTEVSSLDNENGITLSDVAVPGLDVRRASTTVEVPSGGGLMIAGLLKSESLNGMSGLPGIRNIPVLGKLISSDSFRRDETELVVIVTPYLVEPYAQEEFAVKAAPVKIHPLAKVFADNVRRIFGDRTPDFGVEEVRYGYLLD